MVRQGFRTLRDSPRRSSVFYWSLPLLSTGLGRIAATVSIDLTRLAEDELLGLNRRIVEHLRLTEFTVGVRVEFTTDPNRPHT